MAQVNSFLSNQLPLLLSIHLSLLDPEKNEKGDHFGESVQDLHIMNE